MLIGKCHIGLASRILDVGCGAGRLLERLGKLGFRNLTGIDLFVPAESTGTSNNVTIIKGEMKELEGRTFDLIMMHHFLEHCSDQAAQLNLAASLLAPKGSVLVRQPVSDSEAFRRYQSDWCQLGAPRHAVIHSLKSMGVITEQCGLRIKNVIWDSTDLQFWASEQYRLNVPLYDDRSYLIDPERSLFSNVEIAKWKKEAAILNRMGSGDQAAFILERMQ